MSEIRKFNFSYLEFESIGELTGEDQELISAAREAAKNAYAPYSKFRVGAALRLGSGQIVSGSNVENAAFPSGICAERTALAASVSNYPGDYPVTLAIAALTENGLTDDAVSPCGNCRQVIAEEEHRTGKPIKLILAGKKYIRIIESVSDLLPLQFTRDNLTSDRP
ncbi:MAG: cytidine deaminase [Bacteroidales bacterium]